MTTGPRPAGVNADCFAPETHTPEPCDPAVDRRRPALRDVVDVPHDRRLADLLQLLGRPGTLMVAGEGDQRRARRSASSAPANECRLQPGLGADGEPDDGRPVRRVHQRQHAGRGPVPDGALDGRRRHLPGPVPRHVDLRPELPAVGVDAAGLHAARPAGQPPGPDEQLLPRSTPTATSPWTSAAARSPTTCTS